MQYFFFYKKTLYVTTDALIVSGKTRSNIDKAVSTKQKPIAACKLPELGVSNYFKWDNMSNGWRECIETKFGNPYDYVAREPIMQMIVRDDKAEEFYLAHRYGEGTKSLNEQTVRKYTTAASLYKMNNKFMQNPKPVLKQLGINVPTFYEELGEIMKAWKEQGKEDGYLGYDQLPGDFAASGQRFRNNAKEFEKVGYEFLIDDMYGNTLSAKINDEVSESLLVSMLGETNQYDYALIAIQYNKWARENNYKQITPQTVANWHGKYREEIDMTREGRETYNATTRRKVYRMRPTQPTYLWESDDNHLDWWFAGDKANEYRKIKGIMVTDSFNDLVIGYAITDGELAGDALVKMAYLCAAYYIKGLVKDGNWYLPFEVKTDQWNISQLKPFYKNLAHYEETPVGSKNRGWLENFFGHIDWERSLKIGNNNYTGHNITAKTRGVNMEATKANKKNWKHISEAGDQMFEFVERLRKMPRNYDPNNKSREEEWLDAWHAMPAEKKRPITDEQMLLKFGFRHTHENRITDQGIRPTILGEQYKYAVPPRLYLQNKGKKVSIIYDPYDMSRVLVTDDEGLRFMAYSMTPVAGCMADMQEFGGRTLLNKILAEAKDDSKKIEDKKAKRTQVLLENSIDTETILKLGVSVPKQLKQWAEERAYLPETGEEFINYEEVNQPKEFNIYDKLYNR